jgi:replicative DNA helicase
MSLDLGVGFKKSSEWLEGEREERLERSSRILSFCVKFLDEALGGVFPNDLVLVGGASGEGKTALLAAIAQENAKKKKRVHYFALEAEKREIERRMKFREISNLVYSSDDCKHLRPRLNYIDWYSGKLENAIGQKVEAAVAKIVAEKFCTMSTFYKEGNFGIEELSKNLLAIQDVTDAAFLDHLHYVEIDDDNEHRGLRAIVQRLRDIALMLGKPIFVGAHLRKKDRKGGALVPDLDDIMGTSDTPKVATKVIMIARARDQESPQPHLWPTYVYAPKCRMDGTRTRYGAVLLFNARLQAYEDEYQIGTFSPGLDKFEFIDQGKIPNWAESAYRVRRDYHEERE